QVTEEAASRIGRNGAGANEWATLAQGGATLGDVDATRAAVRRGLELERNLDTVLGGAYALVIVRDVTQAQRLRMEAGSQPGADAPDAQFGFKLVDALVKWRQGDRAAIDALPPP